MDTERDEPHGIPEWTPDPSLPAPTLADDGSGEHGRIGYGRFGAWSPLLLGLVILAALLGIWWFGHRENAAERERRTGNVTGEMAPDFTLTLLDGTRLSLSDLRGQVVVVNFWASWCGPCREESPVLEAYSRQAAERGEDTTIVGVGIRTDQDEDARAFVEEYGLTYPIGRDTDTDQPGVGPIEAAFGIPSAYPATVFIGPDGRVDRYHLGPITADQLAYAVAEARKG